MEATIKQFICILLNIADNQNIGHIITANLTYRNLLWTLLNLAVEKNFHRIDDLENIVNKALKAEEIRNQIVHSQWTSGPRVKITVTKQGATHRWENYDIGELTRLADQIDRVDTAFSALEFAYIDWCHKKGDTPRGVAYIE